MTISLTPEIENALALQAQRRGLTADQLAQQILLDKLREMENGARLTKLERDEKDLEIINRNADRLNEEAMDVLKYQIVL
jgi:phage gp46-like protein